MTVVRFFQGLFNCIYSSVKYQCSKYLWTVSTWKKIMMLTKNKIVSVCVDSVCVCVCMRTRACICVCACAIKIRHWFHHLFKHIYWRHTNLYTQCFFINVFLYALFLYITQAKEESGIHSFCIAQIYAYRITRSFTETPPAIDVPAQTLFLIINFSETDFPCSVFSLNAGAFPLLCVPLISPAWKDRKLKCEHVSLTKSKLSRDELNLL